MAEGQILVQRDLVQLFGHEVVLHGRRGTCSPQTAPFFFVPAQHDGVFDSFRFGHVAQIGRNSMSLNNIPLIPQTPLRILVFVVQVSLGLPDVLPELIFA